MASTNSTIRLANGCPYCQKRIAHCTDLGEYMMEAINRQWLGLYGDIKYFEHSAYKQIVNLINPKLTLLEQWLLKRGQFQVQPLQEEAIMSETDEIKCQRKTSREIILAKAEIKIDGNWHNCRIINISAGGAKLQMRQRVDIGLIEFLKVRENDHLKANVVWRQKNEIGIAFTHDTSEISGVIMELLAS